MDGVEIAVGDGCGTTYGWRKRRRKWGRTTVWRLEEGR